MSLMDNPEFMKTMRQAWEPVIKARLQHGGIPLPGDADDNEQPDAGDQTKRVDAFLESLYTDPSAYAVVDYEPEYACSGPACDKKADLDECLDHWIIVARIEENTRHFCSLRCLANWLAGELAKEESR